MIGTAQDGSLPGGCPPSVSIGVVTFDPASDWSLEELAAAADAAMYDDKKLRKSQPLAG